MLEKIEREQINERSGLTEEQEIEMRAIVLDLNERLDMNDNDFLRDSELDELLNDELDNESSKIELEKMP